MKPTVNETKLTTASGPMKKCFNNLHEFKKLTRKNVYLSVGTECGELNTNFIERQFKNKSRVQKAAPM